MTDDLLPRVQEFLDRFETVFYGDWACTRDSLRDIPCDGSFLDPTPGELFTGDAWSNYAGLLDAYRELRAFMISEGIHPDG